MAYKKYFLPLLLSFFAIAIFLYSPVPKVKLDAGSSLVPQIESASPLYKRFNKKAAAEKTYLEIETALVKYVELKRDPFVKSGSVSGTRAKSYRRASRSRLRLQGIWDSDEQKVAFINGRMLRVNDSFNGYKVMDITDTEVSLKRYGKTYILKLEG